MTQMDPLVAYPDDYAGNGVHHPFTAYNQGHDAAEAGHHSARCPYTDGRERRYWMEGHLDASLDLAGAVLLFDPRVQQEAPR